jgi:hypothetical protein
MYKGSGLNQAWVVEDEPLIGKDWSFAASKSGWTNNKMGYQWLVKHFDPLTRADSARRLLIVDGHGSHVTTKFASYCFNNNINLLIMPAHCSHKLQPLDVALFKPLKKAMSNLARRAQAFAGEGGLRSTKHDWTKDLAHARYQAFTKPNVEAGWRDSGLYPLNRNRVAPYP